MSESVIERENEREYVFVGMCARVCTCVHLCICMCVCVREEK